MRRRRFWKYVGFGHADWMHIQVADQRTRRLLREGPSEVVLWRGVSTREVLVGLRWAAELLRAKCAVYEVVNTRHSPNLPAFFSAIAMQTARELGALVAQRVPVIDLADRAASWERLKKSGGLFRGLEGARVVELPDDAYDALILRSARGWTDIRHAVGSVMVEVMLGDWVVAWRMRELIRRGLLEGRGEGPFGPAEIRASATV